jgi:hypothetical protein
MKIKDFEKLTKARMVEEYKNLSEKEEVLKKELKDSDTGLKEAVKKNAKLEKAYTDLNKLSLEVDNDRNAWMEKAQSLESELESKTVPRVDPDDVSFEGTPLSEFTEEQLIPEIHRRNKAHNELAKKYKKLKKKFKEKK